MTNGSPTYDVFLRYNWLDHGAVEQVAHALRERGLTPFLDRWYLSPGQNWLRELERLLGNCRAVAVFIGESGLGAWQQRESDLALVRNGKDERFPVIPVLLPGAEPPLGFLSLFTWVDLQRGGADSDVLNLLAAAVRQEALAPAHKAQIEKTIRAICPYRGLQAFREEDAPFFCGREAFAAELVRKVEGSSFVAVVGASGSGKSSVVRAGLVPRLRHVGEGSVWDIATMVPGDRPLHNLAAALLPKIEPSAIGLEEASKWTELASRLAEAKLKVRDLVELVLKYQPGTERFLLVVDQWEELYTQCEDDERRRRFIDEILESTAKNGPLYAVLTLRGDFFGHALAYRPLADRLQNAAFNLGPMIRDELQDVISIPADKVGLDFQPGLVEAILDDVGDEPGNLPLLEFVLTQLWENRDSTTLTHKAYGEMGGVKGAIGKRADDVLAKLTSEQREVARRVFVQLVHPGKDTEDTRRRASLSGLGEAALPIVQELARARLIVTGKPDPGIIEATDSAPDESGRSHAPEPEETVEVAHEALIRNWNTFRNWMKEDRAFRLWQEDFQALFRRWRRNKRDEGALLRGGQLAEAERWRGERGDALTAEEVEFIDQGVRLRRRTEWRRKVATAASLLVAAVMAGVGAYAWYASNEAERNAALAKKEAERATAEAQRAEKALRASQAEYLVRQGQDLFDAEPLLGIRLALEGLKHATDGGEAPPASIAEAAVKMAERGHLFKLGGDIDRIYSSRLNTHFVVDHRHTPDELLRSADGEVLTTLAGNIREVTFSPDAENSVFVAEYTDAPAELRRSADGAVLATLAGRISEVTFSPDTENSVFVAEYTDAPAELRRSADGAALATLASERGTSLNFDKVTFSPDAENSVFVTNYTDTPDELRRSADGEVLATLADTIRGTTFSPDAENSVFVAEYIKAPGELRRSADGAVLAPAELRRSADGELLATLGGFFKSFQRVTFSPDAEQSVFVAEYTNVPGELRRSADGEVLATLAGNIRWVDFSPDAENSVFVVNYTDAPDELRRSADGELLATLAGNMGDVVFSPDAENSVFVATYTDAPGELRRSADGEVLATLTGNLGGVTFSPDAENSVFVATYTDTPGELRRSADGELLATLADTISAKMPFELVDPRESVTFSPDPAAAVFLVSYRDAPAELRRSADGELLASFRGIGGAIFSPEGAVLVVNYHDAPGELRRSADGELLATLAGTISPITISPMRFVTRFEQGRAHAQGVTFAPDTERVVFVVDYVNGASELWLNSGNPRRLRQMEGGSAGYLFDREARRMLVWYGDGRAYYLDIEWLKAVTNPKGVSMDELTDLACEQLFTTKWFDEAALAKYLAGRPSQVCQDK